MRRYECAALLPLLLSTSPLFAEEASKTWEDPVIVTASRTPEPLSETLAAVTVITRGDIERLQATELSALLSTTPGIAISNSGGPGKATSVFLRGTSSSHVLVLVDGIKLNSALLGGAPFEQIPVDQIERIEIVRGPRSSLYGSEALGGVIQIFTRRGGEDGLVPSFSLRGGSDGSASQELGLRGSAGPAWYAASLSGRTTDGFNAQRDAGEPDDDGFRQVAGSLRGGWRFGADGEINAHYLRAEGRSEYDSAWTEGDDSTDMTLEVLGLQAQLPRMVFWQPTVSLGLGREAAAIREDRARTDRFGTRREQASWLNDLRLSEAQTLLLGLDYQRDRAEGWTQYEVDSRDNTGVFAQYRGGFGAHELQLSLRQDDNEQFGTHGTGGAAWGWRFTEALRLSAAYGTAFKAPTFNDLYYPGFGNPDLEPERARSAELGLEGMHEAWNWSLRGYRSEIDDLIVFLFQGGMFAPFNVEEAVIVGVEASAGVQLDAWRLQAALGWLDPQNRTGENDGKILRRRARETARVDVDYDFGGRAALGASLTASGRRYEDAANTQTLGGYALLDVRAEIRVLPAWLLQASVENALNKHYETAQSFNQPGASYWLGLRYSPGT